MSIDFLSTNKLLDEINVMINTEETDNCIICGAETPYKKDTHIDERKFYVEGAGQLCENCYKNLYEINIKDELKEI